MGFIIYLYIIFETNRRPNANCCFFAYYRVSKKRQTESKRNETFGNVIFSTNVIQETWSGRQERSEEATRQGGAPTPWACPPPSWAPRSSIDLLFPFIYIHIPRKHPGSQRKTISTIVTFCIHETPSWSLRRCSTRGGIDHGGLLHQYHSPSDEL